MFKAGIALRVLATVAILGFAPLVANAAPVTPESVMSFKEMIGPVLADDGSLVAFTARPDRGDPEGRVRRANGQRFVIPLAKKPVISPDSQYVMFERPPSLLAKEKATKKERKKLKNGRVLLHSKTGDTQEFERVKQTQFSHDGRFLLVLFEPHDESDEEESEDEKSDDIDTKELGSELLIKDLLVNTEKRIANVRQFAIAEEGFGLAYSTSVDKGLGNGIYWLDQNLASTPVFQQDGFGTGEMSWDRTGRQLAFTWGDLKEKPRQRKHGVGLAEVEEKLRWQQLNHADFIVSGNSTLTFSKDGLRLFIGRQSRMLPPAKKPKLDKESKLTDINALLARKDLVVWHGDDPRIKPHEIKEYDNEVKRTYLGVWHLEEDNKYVQLTDGQVPELHLSENARYQLASTDIPYRKMISWAGFYRDWYLVDLLTGERRLLVTQAISSEEPTLSPGGRYVVWHVRDALHWHDVKNNHTRQIASGFSNEDHDYPSPAPGYGYGPWLDEDAALLLYDKFDIWKLDNTNAKLTRLTEGRENTTQYRIMDLDPDSDRVAVNATLLVHGVNDHDKSEGLYRLTLADNQLATWQHGDYRLKFLARAKRNTSVMLSFERYDRFPDLYLAEGLWDTPEQLSRMGDQVDELDWGRSKLVYWRTPSGRQAKGVLITPPGYQGKRPLPTLVYFYRFMSQRLHQFPQMRLNHRPNFPWFSSEGYAIFLPDIVFDIGKPGSSAVDALVSGVDALVDMGVADPKAIGLQGHSWAGYQSAFVATQTNKFAAIVSGAPVSNMTSAYTGIRLGSGLSRQFQYEAGQSRIGRSLYNDPKAYIDNSPVFFADQIETPMVIMFGDEDEAVPWQQGIELYLAMRRLGKDVVMLQYEGEPHHLKKYPNKLDYSLKMMAFL